MADRSFQTKRPRSTTSGDRKELRNLGLVVVLAFAPMWSIVLTTVAEASAAQAPSAARSNADFNGDGFEDLAVGVPRENVGDVSDAGAVDVLYGSASGPTGATSQLLTQDSPGVGSSAEEDDVFGAVVVAGDFNGDGIGDLAIGAPGETVGDVLGAGAINVLYGSAAGLGTTGSQLFTQDSDGIGSTAEAVDSFGGALGTGDFNGDGTSDLAVGVPGESVGGIEAAGAVNLLYGSAAGLVATGSQLFTQDTAGVGSTAEAFDTFGQTLAIGDFDHNGTDDLAVAARLEAVGSVEAAGAVNVLYSSDGRLRGAGSQLFTQDTAGVGSTAERADNFGFALAAGDFDANGADDLAVGAPTESVGTIEAAGAVNVLYSSDGRLRGAGSQLFTQDTAGVGSTVEAADDLGFALAAGDFDANGADDLAVAAPVEDVGTVADAGAINVLYGSVTKLTGTNSQLFTQDSPGIGSTVEEGDSFGFALGSIDLDAVIGDLIIGVPFESVGDLPAAGAVHQLYGSPAGLRGVGSRLLTQDTTNASAAEPFDAFGASLGVDSSNARCCLA